MARFIEHTESGHADGVMTRRTWERGRLGETTVNETPVVVASVRPRSSRGMTVRRRLLPSRMLVILSLTPGLIFALSGCGTTVPTPADGEDQITSQYSSAPSPHVTDYSSASDGTSTPTRLTAPGDLAAISASVEPSTPEVPLAQGDPCGEGFVQTSMDSSSQVIWVAPGDNGLSKSPDLDVRACFPADLAIDYQFGDGPKMHSSDVTIRLRAYVPGGREGGGSVMSYSSEEVSLAPLATAGTCRLLYNGAQPPCVLAVRNTPGEVRVTIAVDGTNYERAIDIANHFANNPVTTSQHHGS